MTPPTHPVPGARAPAPILAAPKAAPITLPEPGKPSLPGSSSYVPLNGDTDAFKTKADLSAAITDVRLFGGALKDYEAGKSDKYLRVNLALDAIRSALSGDGKSAIAVQRISMWLSEPSLLTDKAVAHVARVNLVKALQRAPKDAATDASVKAILEALQKNYGGAPAKTEAAPPAEVPKSLSSQLEDANLFGERFKEYDGKKTKEYLTVNLAIMEIRKVAGGKIKDVGPAQIRIEKWLRDTALLTDKVPHQARVNLIKVLSAAPSTDAIAAVITALKANYSVKAVEPAAPAAPSEVKAKTEKGVTSYATQPRSKAKEKREDDVDSFQKGMGAALKPTFARYLKNNESGLSAEMSVTVDNKTGLITDITFAGVKASASEGQLKEFFAEVANVLRTRFRFKAGTFDSGDFGFMKAKINFVAQ